MRNSVRKITIQFAAQNEKLLENLKAGFKGMGQELEKTNKTLNGFQSTLSGIQKILGASVLGVGIASLTNLADSYQKLGDRITVFEGSQERAATTLENISRVADRTKSSIQDVATVYTRLALSLKETGITSQSLLFLTEQLQNSFRLSGSTAAEATAAVVQLSQGLASGQLRGQELRSVLEQNAVFGGLLAEQLGKSRGELLKYSEAIGGIKAKDVIEAILNGSEKLNKESQLLGATFSETTQKGLNQFTRALGEMNSQLGGSAAYATGMNLLIDNLKLLSAVAIGLAVTALPALITQLELMGAAFLLNPVTGIIAGLVAGITYAILETDRFVGKMLQLRAVIREFAARAVTDILEFAQAIGNLLSFMGKENRFNEFFDDIIASSKMMAQEAKKDFKDLENSYEQNEKARAAIANLGVTTFQQQQAALRKELEKTLKFGNNTKASSTKQLLDQLNQSFNDGKIDVAAYNIELLRLTDIISDKKGTVAKFKMMSDVVEGNLQRAFEYGLISLKEYTAALEAFQIGKLEEGFNKGYISAAKYHEEIIQISNEFLPGSALYTGVNNYLISIGTVSSNVAGAIEKTFTGLEDKLLEFMKTGKASFKDFAYTIIEDINRIILRAMIIQPIANGILGAIGNTGVDTGASGLGANFSEGGFAKGGAFNKGTQFFANGGIVNRATSFGMSNGGMGVMGEAGPEAILPLERGSGGKLGVSASQTPVIINVINNSDAQVTQSETTGPSGEKQIQLLIQSTVRDGISSGTFDKALNRSFNLNRRGS
jgi:lambda family phage tail tape measure protein